jgi:hypothetical protein
MSRQRDYCLHFIGVWNEWGGKNLSDQVRWKAARARACILFQLNEQEQREVDEYLRGRFKVKDEEPPSPDLPFTDIPTAR